MLASFVKQLRRSIAMYTAIRKFFAYSGSCSKWKLNYTEKKFETKNDESRTGDHRNQHSMLNEFWQSIFF